MKKTRPTAQGIGPSRVDTDRRRVLVGIAAAGGSLLLPAATHAQVCEEIRERGRQSDRKKCRIKKGTLAQPEYILQCKESVAYDRNVTPCTQIVKP